MYNDDLLPPMSYSSRDSKMKYSNSAEKDDILDIRSQHA